jgi:Caspase domain/Domain of unknown function (DUF4384)
MSPLKRRHFLQLSGSTLAAIGLSQFDLFRQGNQYARVLAQDTPRKLALLVGINAYPSPVPRLQGSINDVYLQQELLIHRFGFNPSDILILTDDNDLKPTRDNIIQAYQSHLIDLARPGDVVVFHFSGHGALVQDPNPIGTESSVPYRYNGTLVPQDALPTPTRGNSDIMGKTLFLLMTSVRTDNLTVVLDSCHSGATTRGNSTVRSADNLLDRGRVPSEAELELQASLLANLGWTTDEFQKRRQQGIAKGVALGAASRYQEAVDASFSQEALDTPFSRFHAGAFTYLLTRYLWQITRTEAVSSTEVNLKRSTQIMAIQHNRVQEPVFDYASEADKTAPLYFTTPSSAFAEAVITKVTENQVEFWLGGTSVQNLEAEDTFYTLVSPSGQVLMQDESNPMLLKKVSRNGLYGYGQLVAGDMAMIQPGILLREQVLGLPSNPTLKVQVDTALGTQTNEAKMALENVMISSTGINRLEVYLLSDQTETDYIFGRFTAENQAKLANISASLRPETLPPLDTLGLFTPQEIPVANTFGITNESIAGAVARLKSKLTLFLTNKVLRGLASINSRLAVEGEIFTPDRPEVSIPIGASTSLSGYEQASFDSQTFKTNELIQIRVDNRERRQELYLSCLAIYSDGELIVLYPGDWNVPEEAARIERNSSLTIPRQEDGVEFRLNGTGFIEILTLVSTEPLRNTLKGLQTIARSRGVSRGWLAVSDSEPFNLIRDLLGDVDQLSRSGNNVESSDSQSIIDTGVLSTLSTTIEII